MGMTRMLSRTAAKRNRQRITVAGVLVAGMLVAGCSPSLTPLYRDFDASVGPDEPTAATLAVGERIRRAVLAAGWELTESPADNVVATVPKVVRRWGLYRTEVYIEVTPVNRTYVRVLVHPYRVYFTGHRSKMPFLKRSIRNAVFPDLREAFEAEGIVDVGYARERDGVRDGQ